MEVWDDLGIKSTSHPTSLGGWKKKWGMEVWDDSGNKIPKCLGEFQRMGNDLGLVENKSTSLGGWKKKMGNGSVTNFRFARFDEWQWVKMEAKAKALKRELGVVVMKEGP
jgi:hypothetical protein